MNIVYASDDNYAEIMGVSMLSLFENNKDTSEIVVYVLDSQIRNDNKQKLQQIADIYNRQLNFISIQKIYQIIKIFFQKIIQIIYPRKRIKQKLIIKNRKLQII